MKRLSLACFPILLLICGMLGTANAAIIDFTGGTVTMMDGTTGITNNATLFENVDYYVQNGFKLDFIGNTGGTDAFSAIVGNYYPPYDNDVIHAHWSTGAYGDITMVKVTKTDGSSFDLNYFILTSNTDTGGGPASGNEKAYIHASGNGITDDYSQLLPPEDWGFPGTQIFLGSQFDSVKAFWFTVADRVDCFGMDEFYIDQPAPPSVPEPATMVLLSLGLIGIIGLRGKGKN